MQKLQLLRQVLTLKQYIIPPNLDQNVHRDHITRYLQQNISVNSSSGGNVYTQGLTKLGEYNRSTTSSTAKTYTVSFTDSKIANASALVVCNSTDGTIDYNNCALCVKIMGDWYITNGAEFHAKRSKVTNVNTSGSDVEFTVDYWNSTKTDVFYVVS